MNKYLKCINYLISKKTLKFQHLLNVYNLLRKWNCNEDTGFAGLFHNIYLDKIETDRNIIKKLIGEKAEKLILSQQKNVIYMAVVMSNDYINVIDNIFDRKDVLESYFYFRDIVKWGFIGSGNNDEKWRKFNYKLNFSNKIEKKYKLQTNNILKNLNLNKFLKLSRVYASANPYGTVHESHTDTDQGITIMYYLNESWNIENAGETVFHKDGDIIRSVIPKPGRVVVFDGSIEHCARDVRRDYNDLRMVLTFKYEITKF
jgi:hypothetical protein